MRFYYQFAQQGYVQAEYQIRPDYVQHIADSFGVIVPNAILVGPDNDVWVCYAEEVRDLNIVYVLVGHQGERQ